MPSYTDRRSMQVFAIGLALFFGPYAVEGWLTIWERITHDWSGQTGSQIIADSIPPVIKTVVQQTEAAISANPSIKQGPPPSIPTFNAVLRTQNSITGDRSTSLSSNACGRWNGTDVESKLTYEITEQQGLPCLKISLLGSRRLVFTNHGSDELRYEGFATGPLTLYFRPKANSRLYSWGYLLFTVEAADTR